MSAAPAQFPTATILAYPRIGRERQLKRALEARWAGRITDAELTQAADELRRENLSSAWARRTPRWPTRPPSTTTSWTRPFSWVRSRRASQDGKVSTFTSRSRAATTRWVLKR